MGSLNVNAQTFTYGTTMENVVGNSVSAGLCTGTKYTLTLTQSAYNIAAISIYNNGSLISSVNGWTTLGATAEFACYTPCVVKPKLGTFTANTVIYLTVDVSAKTVTASTTAPNCGDEGGETGGGGDEGGETGGGSEGEVNCSPVFDYKNATDEWFGDAANISYSGAPEPQYGPVYIGAVSENVVQLQQESVWDAGNGAYFRTITLSPGTYRLTITAQGNTLRNAYTYVETGGTRVGTKQAITSTGDVSQVFEVTSSASYKVGVTYTQFQWIKGFKLEKCVPTKPTLKVTPTSLTRFETCANTASDSQTITVSGTRLKSDVAVSLVGADAAAFEIVSPAVPITASGTLAETTVTVRLKSSPNIGYKSTTLVFESDDAESKTISLSGYVAEANTLQSYPLSGNLDYNDCGETPMPTEGSFKLQGYCLGSSVTVTAPTNFQVFDDDSKTWKSSTTISEATFTKDIQVRLVEGLPVNMPPYTGNVEITSGGQTRTTVPVSGTSATIPTNMITDKNVVYNQFGSSGTTPQSITVTSTTGLTENITAKAPAGFVIATSAGGAYGASVTLPSSGGTVWVRPDNPPAGTLVRGNVTFSSPTLNGVEIQTVNVMHGAQELCHVTSTTPAIENGEVFVCNGTFSIDHGVIFVVNGELHLTNGYRMNSGTLHVLENGAVIIQKEFILTTGKDASSALKKVEVINEGRIELHGTPDKGLFHMASNLDNNGTAPSALANAPEFSNYGKFGISNAEVIMGQNGADGGAYFYNCEGAIVYIDNEDFPDRKVWFGGKKPNEAVLLSPFPDAFNPGYFYLNFNDGSQFVVNHADVDMVVQQGGGIEQRIGGELYVYNGNMDVSFQSGSGGQMATISGGLYVIDKTPSDCHQTGMLNIHAGGGNMTFTVTGNLWATSFDGQNTSHSGSNAITVEGGGTAFIGNVGANMPSDNYKIHVKDGTLYYCGNWSEFGDAVGVVGRDGALFWAPTYYQYANEGSPTTTHDTGALVLVVATSVGSVGTKSVGGATYTIKVNSEVEGTLEAYLTYSKNGQTWNYPKTYFLCTTCSDSDKREFFTIKDGSFEIHTFTVGDFSVEEGAIYEQMRDFKGNLISTAAECEEFFLTTPPDKKSPEYSWLPVTLISFKATATAAGGARVQWITQTETNNDYFTLYRSYNGIVFEPIATFAGAGTTTVPQFYEYNDKNFISNIAYYQLGQTDFDGKATMSNIIAVQNMYLPTFEIEKLQNTGNGNYTITFLFPDAESENNITIYNTVGVNKAQYNFAAGTISAQVEAQLQPSGTYIVEHVAGSRKTVKKIVVGN